MGKLQYQWPFSLANCQSLQEGNSGENEDFFTLQIWGIEPMNNGNLGEEKLILDLRNWSSPQLANFLPVKLTSKRMMSM